MTIRYGDDGSVTIVCRRGVTPQCQQSGCSRDGTLLCDFVVNEVMDKTCDWRMCKPHSVSAGINVDYCLKHGKEAVTP